MLMSVDGKISTGNTDSLDFDRDYPKIKGIKEGLQQYYDLEQKTDLYSLNSGKVQVKVGANEPQKNIVKLPVSFLIIDNQPHLNEIGVDNFIKKKAIVYYHNK
jgi:2,5-diamino-6-(ribosylamino)-4(3H)-pyrimidinone 5'-phosphate reductase